MKVFYNRRTWLNPENKDATSFVVAFDGIVTNFKGKDYPSTFLKISDCTNTISLHKTCDDTDKDFIDKMDLLKWEIELFSKYLKDKK